MKTKSAVVITEEQARVMSADEVARLLRLNRTYEIIRNDDGSIKEIIDRDKKGDKNE